MIDSGYAEFKGKYVAGMAEIGNDVLEDEVAEQDLAILGTVDHVED